MGGRGMPWSGVGNLVLKIAGFLILNARICDKQCWHHRVRHIHKPFGLQHWGPSIPLLAILRNACFTNHVQLLHARRDHRARLSSRCRQSQHAHRQDLPLRMHGRHDARLCLCDRPFHKHSALVPDQRARPHPNNRRSRVSLRPLHDRPNRVGPLHGLVPCTHTTAYYF